MIGNILVNRALRMHSAIPPGKALAGKVELVVSRRGHKGEYRITGSQLNPGEAPRVWLTGFKTPAISSGPRVLAQTTGELGDTFLVVSRGSQRKPMHTDERVNKVLVELLRKKTLQDLAHKLGLRKTPSEISIRPTEPELPTVELST